jgi:hypothetical protein
MFLQFHVIHSIRNVNSVKSQAHALHSRDLAGPIFSAMHKTELAILEVETLAGSTIWAKLQIDRILKIIMSPP